ncbi:MAG TPA: hypothetical protein VGR21_09390 [Cryptosporangiaceae bacterium]|nr:hypothetical protein [Cryptosporangiaceae bacterium]
MEGRIDPHSYRAAFAPGVSEARRRHLSAAEADSSLLCSAVLGGLLTLLFGVAGVVVLIAGVLPPDASTAFRLVAGGGCLVAAVWAAVYGIQSAVAEWHRRSAAHDGQYLPADALAARARQDPHLGEVLSRTQRAAARIRASAAYQAGALAAAIDGAALDQAEWTVVSTAYRDGVRADLLGHVDQLEELADTAERIQPAVSQPPHPPEPTAADGLADALDRANATAAAIESLVSPPRKLL